jgi:hypothetical protein
MSGTILNGGWTTHGHSIDGVPQDASMKPSKVARCGGPKLCNKCARDQANAQSAFHGFDGQHTLELADVIYAAMPWEGDSYEAAAESIAQAVVTHQAQEALNKPDTTEPAKAMGVEFDCPRCDRRMLVTPLISEISIRVEMGKTITRVKFIATEVEHACPTTNLIINT